MDQPRYLTKSRFKLGHSCPTKLFYTRKKEYPDSNDTDPFLEALAEGGFQVGELAKYYFPCGHDIVSLDYETAIHETNLLLQQEEVVIYEAAIKFEGYFIRIDVLHKVGNSFHLYEVKAKSFSGGDYTVFLDKKNMPSSSWDEYLIDVAFQKFVLQSSFPDTQVNAYLMLCDKTAHTTVEGLNQKFFIDKSGSRTSTRTVGDVSLEALGEPILQAVNIDPICAIYYDQSYSIGEQQLSFSDYCDTLLLAYQKDEKLITAPSLACWGCEFSVSKDGRDSGFKECLKHWYNWSDEHFEKPTINDVWNFPARKKLFKEGRLFLNELREDEFLGNENVGNTLSTKERQWLQIDKMLKNDKAPYIDFDGLKAELDSWVYPLHFIDFETSAVAIPFHKGMRPYEVIAFQYSHHIVHEDGRIEHKSEYINSEMGSFPNFDFIRHLKNDLEQDEGSIFRYATHENTIVNAIYRQLLSSIAPPSDRQDLLEFIESISYSNSSAVNKWAGTRNMIDLLVVVKNYYYHPLMGKSNSIKKVLPAILNDSKTLQNKYSKPIYGTDEGVPSLNFKDWTWIKFQDDMVVDPYKLLGPIMEDVDQEVLNKMITDGHVADGGSAMMAYARMQFTEMSDAERDVLKQSLLRYCELDTFAMVMIYEYFKGHTNA